ncbi:ydjO [Escherichia coli]|nr:ydjO [Escherichia coli]
MMSLWDALRMNMMISYQELVRTFPKQTLTAENSDIRCKYMSIYLKNLKLLRVTLHKSVNKLAQIV